jgi:hypothetical protein
MGIGVSLQLSEHLLAPVPQELEAKSSFNDLVREMYNTSTFMLYSNTFVFSLNILFV